MKILITGGTGMVGSAFENIETDHELIQYAMNNDNLIITPHIGGNTIESFEKTELFLAKKLLDSLETE